MNTFESVCKKQVNRSIYCCWFAVAFRVDNGVLFTREFEDIFIHLN